jgi:uncharacterized protein YyaL (SSP411 family)
MNGMDVQQLIDNTLNNFSVSGSCLREFYPPKDSDRGSCYLWSYFATTGMLYRALKAGYPVETIYRELVEGFVYYRSGKLENGLVKYHSQRGELPDGGNGACFFDDNIWTARNFLFAYDVFKEEKYLHEAQLVTEYVNTGWNSELGGLVWNENGLTDSANTQELERGLSANACASLVNSILYRLTGKDTYLHWAKEYYNFCKKVQDSISKIYYNGVHTCIQNGKRSNGEVNKDLYSYNTGSMILADLELFKITADQEYMEDAKASSEAAYKAFVRKDEVSGMLYIKDFVWFTAILAEGWQALAGEKRSQEKEYLEVLGKSIDYSFRHKNDAGLLPHDLVCGWRKEDDYDRMLLTHSGIAEIAVITYANN